MNLDAVVAATVRVHVGHTDAALGVLVNGGYILTAAHNIEIKGTLTELMAGMAEGDGYRVEVTTATGVKLVTQVCMLEPVNDLAALAPIAVDTNPYEWRRFMAFVASTKPVTLAPCLPRQTRSVWRPTQTPVRIRTHHGAWIKGLARRFDADPRAEVRTKRLIRPRSSGAPIVDSRGRLLAVVAHTHSPSEESESEVVSLQPLAPACLPAWLLKNMARQKKARR